MGSVGKSSKGGDETKKLVIIVIIAICCSVYFAFNGTPWGNYTFRKKAENYMKQTFPDEVIVNIYSFVEMDYSTKFYTKTGKKILFI